MTDETKPDMRDEAILQHIAHNTKALSNETNAPDIRYVAALCMKSDILIMLSRVMTSLDTGDTETAFNQVNELFGSLDN